MTPLTPRTVGRPRHKPTLSWEVSDIRGTGSIIETSQQFCALYNERAVLMFIAVNIGNDILIRDLDERRRRIKWDLEASYKQLGFEYIPNWFVLCTP